MNEQQIIKSQKALGYRITELRKRVINEETGKYISQDELALRAGFSKKTIGELERGNSNPEFKTLLILCKELNVTLNILFDYDEDYYYKLSKVNKS